MMTQTNPNYNLMMLSGDSSVARGIEGAFHEMLGRFSAYWRRIDILTPTAPDATPRTIHGNVHVHPAPYHRLLQPVFIRRKGAALLAQRDYHLVVSHDFGFFYNGIGAYWLLRHRGIPYISEIHHVEGYPQATSTREKLWRAAAMRYLPFAGRHAAAIRTVNQEVPHLLRTLGIPDEKILVLHSLYIDFTTFQPQAIEKAYDLLFVGRLVSNKGIQTILQALVLVKQTHPTVMLGIRGEGSLQPALNAFIREQGLQDHVRFIPRTDDMAHLYNQSRMLICASTVEGNPRVTVEAMACGVPVISTPVGIMPEIIADGENGFLFSWDAAALAQHIRRLLDDAALRERVGKAGQDAVQPFAAEQVIHAYATGYHHIIEREHR